MDSLVHVCDTILCVNLVLTLLLSSLTLLAVSHWAATSFFLYWKYQWLDIPIHMLGGICVALGTASLPFLRVSLPQFFNTYGGYVCIVLLVGTTWEMFEYFAGVSIMDAYFIVDTIIDYCMNLVGVSIGYGIVRSIKILE